MKSKYSTIAMSRNKYSSFRTAELACENIRFSSLFVVGDRGETDVFAE